MTSEHVAVSCRTAAWCFWSSCRRRRRGRLFGTSPNSRCRNLCESARECGSPWECVCARFFARCSDSRWDNRETGSSRRFSSAERSSDIFLRGKKRERIFLLNHNLAIAWTWRFIFLIGCELKDRACVIESLKANYHVRDDRWALAFTRRLNIREGEMAESETMLSVFFAVRHISLSDMSARD